MYKMHSLLRISLKDYAFFYSKDYKSLIYFYKVLRCISALIPILKFK